LENTWTEPVEVDEANITLRPNDLVVFDLLDQDESREFDHGKLVIATRFPLPGEPDDDEALTRLRMWDRSRAKALLYKVHPDDSIDEYDDAWTINAVAVGLWRTL